MNNIVIATTKEWNISNYFKLKNEYDDFNFTLVSNKEDLIFESMKTLNPKYILFPHWSWKIPQDIYDNFDCIVFHMTDVPYGRGGSPFQNLIMRGVYDTKISAIKVDEGLDTGDVYIKEEFNISMGSAEENFIKLSYMIFKTMIPKILTNSLSPSKQQGEITTFQRRTPKDSDLKSLKNKSITKLYDFIRMLDAQGYPKSYIQLDNIKIEFSEVHLKHNKLVGRFEVMENE